MNDILKNPVKLAQALRIAGWPVGGFIFLLTLVELKNSPYLVGLAISFWAVSISTSYILDLVTDIFLKENRGLNATWLLKTLRIASWVYVALILFYLIGQFKISYKFVLTIINVVLWLIFQGLAKVIEGLVEIRDRMKTEENANSGQEVV